MKMNWFANVFSSGVTLCTSWCRSVSVTNDVWLFSFLTDIITKYEEEKERLFMRYEQQSELQDALLFFIIAVTHRIRHSHSIWFQGRKKRAWYKKKRRCALTKLLSWRGLWRRRNRYIYKLLNTLYFSFKLLQLPRVFSPNLLCIWYRVTELSAFYGRL